MALLIVGIFVTACLLLLQGIHVMRRRNMRPFFKSHGEPSLSSGAKIAASSLYTIPSLAIIGALVFALVKNNREHLFEWLNRHAIGLVGGLFLLAYGLLSLLRPDVVLRWVASAYPDYDLGERSSSVEQFVRVLGAFLFAFGLFIFKTL